MPNQGQGFELYAIAGAVIGGTSLSGGAGSVLGDDHRCVYHECSESRSSINGPAESVSDILQPVSVVLGAVLLDIYRTKRATEVRVLAPSAKFKAEVMEKISELKASGAADAEAKISELKRELKANYASMVKQEKEERKALKKQEKEFSAQ